MTTHCPANEPGPRLACVCSDATLISERVILVSGFLSSILKISVRSSSLISGLHKNTQNNEQALTVTLTVAQNHPNVSYIKKDRFQVRTGIFCNIFPTLQSLGVQPLHRDFILKVSQCFLCSQGDPMKKANFSPSILTANKKVITPLRPEGKILTQILALITLKWWTKATGAMLPTLREAQKQPYWTMSTAERVNYTYKVLLALVDCMTVDFIPALCCDAASLVPTVRGRPLINGTPRPLTPSFTSPPHLQHLGLCSGCFSTLLASGSHIPPYSL